MEIRFDCIQGCVYYSTLSRRQIFLHFLPSNNIWYTFLKFIEIVFQNIKNWLKWNPCCVIFFSTFVNKQKNNRHLPTGNSIWRHELKNGRIFFTFSIHKFFSGTLISWKKKKLKMENSDHYIMQMTQTGKIPDIGIPIDALFFRLQFIDNIHFTTRVYLVPES